MRRNVSHIIISIFDENSKKEVQVLSLFSFFEREKEEREGRGLSR